MDKQYIIDEIKRTANGNKGKALGKRLFAKTTGIHDHNWLGKHWARWGDAVKEAGYEPNKLQGKLSDDFLIEKIIPFIKELGKFPVAEELRMRARKDKDFPSQTVFVRLGKKPELARKIVDYCEKKGGLSDVIDICLNVQIPISKNDKLDDSSNDGEIQSGQVYLLKHGNDYKIGKSISVPERYKSIQTQMPHKLEEIHVINTDDISGIENYWHKRFKKKRLKGEWFKLTTADIRAFKKRKFQ